MIKAFLYFLFILFSLNLNAQQNLVPNGSFEEYNWCPDNLNGYFVNAAKYWFMPTTGTSDYFNSCSSDPSFGLPENYIGYQNARTGDAFAGYYAALTATNDNYHEYLSVRLKEPLKKGKLYKLSYYLSLADSTWNNGNPQQYVNYSAAYFSNDSLAESNFFRIDVKPQMVSDSNIFLNDSLGWMKVSGVFIASGGEEFINIGYFCKFDEVQFNYINELTSYAVLAYYFIDDISLIETELEVPNVFTPNNDGRNDFFGINISSEENYSLKILNRWGNIVFDSEISKPKYWDGKHNENNCNEGVYFYIITIENNILKGFFELFR